MNRCVGTLSLLLLVVFAARSGSAENPPPNIVLFLVDDMGVMDTSVPFLTDPAGQPRRYPLNDFYRTPSMERLASQGIRFSQFYAMSVCSPTRVSIMTGQNAARHRVTNWIDPSRNNAGEYGPSDWRWTGLGRGDVTLPRLLRSHGYRTIHVGKGHFGPEGHEGADPLNLGFDVNVGGASFGQPGSYYGERGYGLDTPQAVPHLEAYHGSHTFLTEALTLEAKKRVTESVASGQPFFLYLSHYAVHAPFESDPRFASRYTGSGKPERAQAFAALIEGMDDSLGDVLDHLERLGVAASTLVLFVGDNGTDAPLGDQHVVACAAPLRGKKGAHYEGGMRVPFIAAWARRDPGSALQQRLGIPAGAVQTQLASIEDLFPTLLELAGIPSPEAHAVDGRRLQVLLTGLRDASRPEQFLMHYPHGVHRSNYFSVWRDGDWKVVHHALPEVPTTGGHIQFAGGQVELFNLADDPFESTNLADSRPDQARRMLAALRSRLKAVGALYPVDASGRAVIPGIPERD